MHQDAWGKYIASPAGVVCPPGREPAIGWDGAPKWATLTDGTDTCTAGSREASEAVLTAWDSFYANRNGIMDHLVAVWGRIAREFRTDPAVAGYDLLNEPNHGHHGDQVKTALGSYYSKAIDAIRAAETGPAALHHIVFFETTVFGVAVAPAFTADENIVFAPHNYGESIGNIPIEGLFAYYASLAKDYRTAMWTGEYGWFSDPPANAPKLARYAAADDSLITAGDAWWQWRQACGDPHSIGRPGGTPDPVLIHFQRNRCPGDHNARRRAGVGVCLAAVPPRVSGPADVAAQCLHRRPPARRAHRSAGNARHLVSPHRLRATPGRGRTALAGAGHEGARRLPHHGAGERRLPVVDPLGAGTCARRSADSATSSGPSWPGSSSRPPGGWR